LIFRGNSGYHGGGIGGISTPEISNLTFIQNIGSLGAGMWSGQNFTIRNAVFIGNKAGNGGGIGFNNNTVTVYPIIENATFVENYATTSGGAIYNVKNAQTTLKNSILLRNNSGIFNSTGTTTDVQYSLVQGLSNTDQGNIDATNVQPEDVFIDLINGNYRLKHGSPAIDKGSNLIYTGNLSTDQDVSHFKRQVGHAIDMGAYEYGGPPVISNLEGDVFSYIQGDILQTLDQDNDAEVSDTDSPHFWNRIG
jgi:predicted outer membrane repeat protein